MLDVVGQSKSGKWCPGEDWKQSHNHLNNIAFCILIFWQGSF